MTKATIINFDGNYSEPIIMDEGETSNVKEYVNYHKPYQPKDFGIGYEVDIVDKDHPLGDVVGSYPGCIIVTSDDPNASGRKEWYIGLLPENLKIGETSVSYEEIASTPTPVVPTGPIEIRPYQDAMDESFANSGLDEDAFEDYAEGWNEPQETESLQEMTQEDYDARLDKGITTEILNFNGLMVLYEDREGFCADCFNGEMIKYVAEQIMTGYATVKINIGYEVIIIDENPSGHLAMGDYVIVSSKDLVPLDYAAPLVYAAGGHWCMYLRRENLKHYLTPPVILEQTDFIAQNNLEGTISEVEYEGYEKTEWIEAAIVNEQDIINSRAQLCVYFKTGELKYMETPTKGWAIVKRKKLLGESCQTSIPSLYEVISKLGLSGDIDDTSLMINCTSLKQAKEIADNITSWDFFYVDQDDKVISVEY